MAGQRSKDHSIWACALPAHEFERKTNEHCCELEIQLELRNYIRNSRHREERQRERAGERTGNVSDDQIKGAMEANGNAEQKENISGKHACTRTRLVRA